MRNLILLILIVGIAYSCNKSDDPIFEASIPKSDITFEARPGGAKMNYKLPNNSDIIYIQAKYEDHKGKEIVIKKGYLTNHIDLIGFIKATDKIPVEVTLINKKGHHSKVETHHFSTLDAGGLTLFDGLRASSYWTGARLDYKVPANTDGFIHVNIVDINPRTNKLDTLLIKTKDLSEGDHTIKLSNISNKKSNKTTLVVSTESARGDVLGKKVFKDIPASLSEKMDPKNFEFTGSSFESDWQKTGIKYLFDGDNKGTEIVKHMSDKYWKIVKTFSFISEPHAVPGEWILDAKEEKIPASVKLYCALNIDREWPRIPFGIKTKWMLPNHVKVHGSNDKSKWEEIGEFHQAITTLEEERWCYPSMDKNNVVNNVALMEKAQPACLSVNFDVSEKRYRYYKIEILETFYLENNGDGNLDRRVTFHELELHVKSE